MAATDILQYINFSKYIISTDPAPAEAINNFNCMLCRNAECIFGQF